MPEILTLEDDLTPVAEAFRTGAIVAIPTETVYGLATGAHLPEACERLVRAKGRDLSKPTALLCASLDTALSTVLPELDGRAALRARRLLPGPVTVVVPNPGRRFPWLCGSDPTRIGLRVPVLAASLAAAIDPVGAVAATSANPAGEEAPSTLETIDPALLARCAVAVDGGRTPGGRPSTVVDLTGPEPVVVREGPLSAAEIRARLAGT